MTSVRPERVAAVALGKAVRIFSRQFGRGGGTTLPGFLAQKIDPALIPGLIAGIPLGSIVVSGTNGKTTTCRLIAATLRAAGLEPIHNHEGSNLHQGLATTLLAQADALGRLRASDRSIGLFELDEGAFPQLLGQIRPKVVLFTNIFRDQMDRYFELDYLVHLWRRGLADLPPATTLVLNADDPMIASLGSEFPNPVIYFGLEDTRFGHSQLEHASDTRRCPHCNTDLAFTLSFYGHLGHYRCPNCQWARPHPQVLGHRVTLCGLESSEVEIDSPSGSLSVNLPLPGLYNVYNALAAAAAALALHVPLITLQSAVAGVQAAFGRLERLEMDSHPVYIILVKNPSGFNEVLRMLRADARHKNLLLALNDNVPDGRDVSWIWDVDYEQLRGEVRCVVTSGLRAHDLALRLKYAEWFRADDPAAVPELIVERDVVRALELALGHAPAGEPIYVVPTYTAMWELREVLRQAGRVQPFWEAGRQSAQELTRS